MSVDVTGLKTFKNSQTFSSAGSKEEQVSEFVWDVNNYLYNKTEEQIKYELNQLGIINTRNSGKVIKANNGKEYTIMGDSADGNIITKDEYGNFHLISQNNEVVDKKQTVESAEKNAPDITNNTIQKVVIEILRKNLETAETLFEQQLQDDGWAGDVADAISVLWGSKNRASKVRKDIDSYRENLENLERALKENNNSFEEQFKEYFGKEYNKNDILKYIKSQNEENYQKAFGDKDIVSRVTRYNKSQDIGGSVVKTTAIMVGGVVVGVATGGTGIVALGAAAAGSAAVSFGVNVTDDLTSENGINKEDLIKYARTAGWDGVSVIIGGAAGKAAGSLINQSMKYAKVADKALVCSADVALGAAQEYVETGEVSLKGTLENAAISSVGSIIEDGALEKIKGVLSSKSSASSNLYDLDDNLVAGGLFSRKVKDIKLTTESGWQNFKTKNGEITVLNSNGKIYYGEVGKMQTKEIKLKPGEGKILGDSPDGTSIVIELTPAGDYVIKHIGEKDKISLQATKSPLQGSSGYSKVEINDKNLNKKIKMDASSAMKNTDIKGTPVPTKRVRNVNNTQSSLVKDFGDDFNLNNIPSRVNPGEVFSAGNKLYVNKDGVAVEIKLSKKKFDELFPPEGFALIEQKGLNNCWLVSRLNAMVESSYGRAELYSMFEELPNGDIVVKLKNSKPITFPKGKPVDAVKTSLGDGASPGIEMVEQAVLVRYLSDATQRVDNISELSLASLNDEANSLRHADYEAVKSLFGGSAKTISSNNTNYKAQVEEALEDFKVNEDMGVITWGAHARSLVGYNSQTGVLTFHDPYYASVDIETSLDNLLKKNPTFSIYKKPAASKGNMGVNVDRNVPYNKSKSTNNLDIPDGYIEYKVTMGKRTIIGPNNEIMIESNGGWKRIN